MEDILLLQYERGKENIYRLLPAKVAHEYQAKEKRLAHALDKVNHQLHSEMKAIDANFKEGASGKSADKIAESLDKIGQASLYTAGSFNF